jgi:DMSO/TMAO reductase YedYZ molybdopterin-dependent catalytic subunit
MVMKIPVPVRSETAEVLSMSSERLLEALARNGLATTADAALVPRQTAPDNAEFPVHRWWSWITPSPLFYIRSHFPVPGLDRAAWRLTVDGEVEQPLSLSFSDLEALPRRRAVATLVCAGNRRTEFAPCPPGVPWQDGAISNAEWEGVALADVLALARPRGTASELVLEGADEGTAAGRDTAIRFARGISLERARSPQILLADRMNGAPLPPEHGAPLRAVVPGAYGMDSVKWLVGLRLLDRPFEGHFQKDDYRLFPASPAPEPAPPVGPLQVSSLIAWPASGDVVRTAGPVRVVGYAWSGTGTIVRVEISSDGGGAWSDARLVGPEALHAWRLWEADWRPSTEGTYHLAVRASDSAGTTQPERADWNAKGYANNGVHQVEVHAR